MKWLKEKWPLLEECFNTKEARLLFGFFTQLEKQNIPYYPEKENIFRAFEICSQDNLKCVVLGQDVYPNGEGTGLAFEVKETYNMTPSLDVLNEAIEKTLSPGSFDILTRKSLTNLSREEGVLFLNSSLTVEKRNAGTHIKYWQPVIQHILQVIDTHYKNIPFVLLGNVAKETARYVYHNQKFETIHPVAIRYNPQLIFDDYIFKKVNIFLTEREITPIDWTKK